MPPNRATVADGLEINVGFNFQANFASEGICSQFNGTPAFVYDRANGNQTEVTLVFQKDLLTAAGTVDFTVFLNRDDDGDGNFTNFENFGNAQSFTYTPGDATGQVNVSYGAFQTPSPYTSLSQSETIDVDFTITIPPGLACNPGDVFAAFLDFRNDFQRWTCVGAPMQFIGAMMPPAYGGTGPVEATLTVTFERPCADGFVPFNIGSAGAGGGCFGSGYDFTISPEDLKGEVSFTFGDPASVMYRGITDPCEAFPLTSVMPQSIMQPANPGETGSANNFQVMGGTAPFSYTLTKDGAVFLQNNTSQGFSFIGLETGAYALAVTDVNDCDSTRFSFAISNAPTALCQDAEIFLDDMGAAMLDPADVDGGSSTAFGSVSLSVDPSAFDCGDLGDQMVTLTVTNDQGQSSECMATVTVTDNVAPELVCQDVEVFLDENGEASADVADIVVSEMDNCDMDPIGAFFVPNMGANMFTCADIGTPQERMLEIGDMSGNRDSCTFNVTVLDAIAPELVCQDVDVYLDENGEASADVADIVVSETDNCEMDPTGPFFVPNMGANMFTCDDVATPQVRMLEIGDMSGNRDSCTFNINVLDTIPPTANGMDATIDLDANGQAFLFIADVVDLATLGD
ncbi:MAG: hypothetical protein AAFZ52_05970, partial [Bacteroidota bacterium]